MSADRISLQDALKRSLTPNVKSKHFPKKFACDQCPKRCYTAEGLATHKKVKHP